MSDNDPTTNTVRPAEDSVLTVRLIKSFEYRTEKNMVLQHVNLLTTTVGQLKELVLAEVQSKPAYKVYRTVKFDCLKLYTKAHGSKTTNLIINLDHDDWILDDDSATLASVGMENETELSFFNRELYEAFKINPVQKCMVRLPVIARPVAVGCPAWRLAQESAWQGHKWVRPLEDASYCHPLWIL